MAQDWPDKLIAELCNALKEKRLDLGVSVYQVSQNCGVSQQAIRNYERGERRPTLECLMKVSLALGLKPSELLTVSEKRVKLPTPRRLEALKRGRKPKS